MVILMEKEMMELLDVILRSLVSLVTLFLVTKTIGKKQVSQFSLFDYVIGISIGNFAAELALNLESEYLHGIVAVVIFGIVAYLVNLITMKNLKIRQFFIGKPTLLIKKGKILYKNLQKNRFDINDLLEGARSSGYFDISEIDYAVMEANGKVSFMAKPDYQTPTNKDLKIQKQRSGLCSNLIVDGIVMHEALEAAHKDEKWLFHELKVKGLNLNDVLLATLDLDENFTVFPKETNINDPDLLS